EVAGQRRLNCDLRRFDVANFSDHDLVGIMAENRAKAARERQPFLFVDWNLGDAVDLIFDGIFDREDLVLLIFDLHQSAIQRGCLAAARRTGNQNHAVRFVDVSPELLHVAFGKSDNFEVQRSELFDYGFLVENTDDGVFSVNGRHNRNTEVDGTSLIPRLESAILW